MSSLKELWEVMGPGGLIPTVRSEVGVLDVDEAPCLFTGKPCAGVRGTHTYVTWLGLIVGVITSKEAIPATDYAGFAIDELCPDCKSSNLQSNKVGAIWCLDCDYTGDAFTRTSPKN